LPRLQKIFPAQLGDATAADLYRAVNVVRPSLIRIEADEVTYNLHIVLRLELERALLLGDVSVDELPPLWADRIREYFDLKVPDAARGPLQDIHWAFGVFGYFPTYTLGNLYAAQIFAKASSDLGNLDEQIRSGKFQPLLGWLREHVHRQGSLLPADKLCHQITGQTLQVQPFLNYLEAKFSHLYNF
jgi:carboxypeptidase Taq